MKIAVLVLALQNYLPYVYITFALSPKTKDNSKLKLCLFYLLTALMFAAVHGMLMLKGAWSEILENEFSLNL